MEKILKNSKAHSGMQAAANSTIVQRKIAIGSVNDPLEKEADLVAEQVMRMPEPDFIQRKCSHCEEDEKLQLKPTISTLQRKEEDFQSTATEEVSQKIQTTKGKGFPMDSFTRNFMETRFKTDFSNVNIHNNQEANQLSSELNAHAFTYGKDVYFNVGKYSPHSFEGKRLLAHELTHVVQQTGKSNRYQRKQIQRAAPVVAAAAGTVTLGAVLAWCLSGAAVSVIIDQALQAFSWIRSRKINQNWCRTIFNALFGCVFGMVGGAIRTLLFAKIATLSMAELGLWIKQTLQTQGYTYAAGKWGTMLVMLGCSKNKEKL